MEEGIHSIEASRVPRATRFHRYATFKSRREISLADCCWLMPIDSPACCASSRLSIVRSEWPGSALIPRVSHRDTVRHPDCSFSSHRCWNVTFLSDFRHTAAKGKSRRCWRYCWTPGSTISRRPLESTPLRTSQDFWDFTWYDIIVVVLRGFWPSRRSWNLISTGLSRVEFSPNHIRPTHIRRISCVSANFSVHANCLFYEPWSIEECFSNFVTTWNVSVVFQHVDKFC